MPDSETEGKKLLIVVAHPDDEYAFAATTYRLIRELGWTADQVLITNGESGYRYSAPAEVFYGVAISDEAGGRAHLPAIRKEEARRAGRVLGIRCHYFLDQRDLGFGTDPATADTSNWNRPPHPRISRLSAGEEEQYDVVFHAAPHRGNPRPSPGSDPARNGGRLEPSRKPPPPVFRGREARGRSEPAIHFSGDTAHARPGAGFRPHHCDAATGVRSIIRLW